MNRGYAVKVTPTGVLVYVNACLVHAFRLHTCTHTSYMDTHTYMHAYIHTNIHAYMHAYVHTYMHTNISLSFI